MKSLMRIAVLLVLLVSAAAASYPRIHAYWVERNRPNYRTAVVVRGEIIAVRNSTGTVKPVKSVQVGSVVSGPIVGEVVEFNARVKTNQVLAKIDPRVFEAAVLRDTAAKKTAQAEVDRVQALLQQALNNQQRAQKLWESNSDYISDTEMDSFKFNVLSLQAQLQVAKAAVEQADANLKNSSANLDYTNIRSPVDGRVIDRKIEPGQSLAAMFQTPELFVVAPDMENKMHVFASVDEADIGLIRDAQARGQPVHFTVDAYPDDLFEGTIEQIRFSSEETENVVTYPVVVAAPNPDLKLLPGMTAKVSFQVDKKSDILMIPNAALRFYPKPEQVRPDDRKLLDGADASLDEGDTADTELTAAEQAEAGRNRNRRHVWIEDGRFVKAVEIVTGLMNNKYTELVSGDIKEGQPLVTGVKPKNAYGG